MADSFEREREIFLAALDLEPAQRAAFLDRECADAELRGRLADLLDAHDAQGLATGGAIPIAATPDASMIGRTIGTYTITKSIGAGGMGRVFAAEQSNPSRSVAIKLMRFGLDDDAQRRRFQLEAEVLGRLNHPGIAHIYGAGTVDLGHGQVPYFAMERVEGTPLVRAADQHSHRLEARLELLAEVCDAVQHAHQQGVVHRDLKPDNVLVDPTGRPKVLDFGVSKIIDADAQLATLQTGVGQVIGTLAYMSPEQAGGDSSLVDTRTDVYALGVIGYELVTGQLPIDIRDASITAAVSRICDTTAPLASRVASGTPRDIDTILAKAMAKDRNERYASASALADDLRRFVRHEPIAAAAPSALYVLRRFVARNRALSATLAALALLLVAATVTTSVLAVRAMRAERVASAKSDEATRARLEAEAVSEFLSRDLIRAASASELGDRASLRDALDYAMQRVPTRFAEQPLAEAAVREAAAIVYGQYGQLDAAAENIDRTVELRSAELGPNHPDTLRARVTQAQVRGVGGDESELLAQLEALLPTLERAHSDPRHPDRVMAVSVLVPFYRRSGRLDEARRMLEPIVPEIDRLGEFHAPIWVACQQLGVVLHGLGEFEPAERWLRATIAVQTKRLGARNAQTLTTRTSLGLLLKRTRRYDEAEDVLRETLGALEALVGETHSQTLACLNNLALVHDERGDYERAQELLRIALTRQRATFGEDHFDTLNTMNNLAASYAAADDHARAVELFEQTLRVQREQLAEDDQRLAITMGNLAGSLIRLERYADAEPHAKAAERILASRLSADHGYVKLARHILATLYTRWGKPEQAARWRGQ